MKNQSRNLSRKQQNREETVEEETMWEYADYSSNPEDIVCAAETMKEIGSGMKFLSNKEQDVFYMLCKGYAKKEIAKALGVSQAWISVRTRSIKTRSSKIEKRKIILKRDCHRVIKQEPRTQTCLWEDR